MSFSDYNSKQGVWTLRLCWAASTESMQLIRISLILTVLLYNSAFVLNCGKVPPNSKVHFPVPPAKQAFYMDIYDFGKAWVRWISSIFTSEPTPLTDDNQLTADRSEAQNSTSTTAAEPIPKLTRMQPQLEQGRTQCLEFTYRCQPPRNTCSILLLLRGEMKCCRRKCTIHKRE